MARLRFAFSIMIASLLMSEMIKCQDTGKDLEINSAQLKNDFTNLDKNQDGFVDAHEMRSAMPGVSDDDIGAFFDKYDANSDGVLSLDEYLTITMK